MAWLETVRKRLKALANRGEILPSTLASTHGTRTGWGSGRYDSILTRKLPGSHKDWSREAGDLLLNGVVAVCLDWYVRNWSQGVPQVMVPGQGDPEPLQGHPLIALLRRPQPGFAPSVWWGCVVADYKTQGNAYARIVRGPGGFGLPTALQYLPADMVRPMTGADGLPYWQYATDGRTFDIEARDMIHFRYGRDPYDHRLGRAPLSAVLREIATDNAASTTAFGLVRNNAIPSMIVGPDAKDMVVDVDPEDLRVWKQKMQESFTGDNAGGVAVLPAPYRMDRVSLTPEELALDSVRRLPEERICSAMGLNPMVLGLGSGLERSTYSNYEQAQQAAWEDGMIPLQRQLAEALTHALLPEYAGTPEGAYLAFSVDGVRALADDLDAASERSERLYKAGIIDRAEAKRIVAVEPDDDDDDAMFPGTDPNDLPDDPAPLGLDGRPTDRQDQPTRPATRSAGDPPFGTFTTA